MTTLEKTQQRTAKKIHYVSGRPFFGNLAEYNHDRLGLFQRMAHAGDVTGLYFGPFPGILFNRPEYVQNILVEHAYDFDKGDAIHNTFRPAIGDGIFSSEGAFHRHQRKLMSPPFQPRHIASYADVMGALRRANPANLERRKYYRCQPANDQRHHEHHWQGAL